MTHYTQYGRHFEAFCAFHRIAVIPVSRQTILAYCHDWARTLGNGVSSLSSRFSGIRWFLRTKYGERGHFFTAEKDPDTAREVSRCLQALAKIQGRGVQKSRPLLDGIVPVVLASSRTRSSPLWELQAIIYFWTLRGLFSRPNEVCGKTVGCLQFPPSGRKFVIWHYGRTTKTLKVGPAPYGLLSQRKHPQIYDLLMEYLHKLGATNTLDLILPFVHKATNQIDHSRPATLASLQDRFQSLLTAAGIPAATKYTGNMGRRGGVSSSGGTIPWMEIKCQGHWSPDSKTAETEYDSVALQRRLHHF